VWLRTLVSDPTLSEFITWYPVKKYLVERGHVTQLTDEPCTAKEWWRIQVKQRFIYVYLAQGESGHTSASSRSTTLLSSPASLAR
jgi:hypothetical protein